MSVALVLHHLSLVGSEAASFGLLLLAAQAGCSVLGLSVIGSVWGPCRSGNDMNLMI